MRRREYKFIFKDECNAKSYIGYSANAIELGEFESATLLGPHGVSRYVTTGSPLMSTPPVGPWVFSLVARSGSIRDSEDVDHMTYWSVAVCHLWCLEELANVEPVL